MNPQITKKPFLRWTLWLVTLVFGPLLLFFIAVQIPYVQQQLFGRLFRSFQEQTGFRVTCNTIYLSWYDQLELDNLRIEGQDSVTVISAAHLSVDFQLLELYRNGVVSLDDITLEEGNLNMVYQTDPSGNRELNFSRFIDGIIRFSGAGKNKDTASVPFHIGEISIGQTTVSITDDQAIPTPGQFQPSDFSFLLTDGSFTGFLLHGDTIDLHISRLTGTEQQNQWPVQKVSGDFRFSSRQMLLTRADIQAGKSMLGDSLVLNFQSPDSITDLQSLHFDLRLRNTRIHPDDIRFFSGFDLGLQQTIGVGGQLTGTVPHLRFRDMVLQTGNTSLRGQVEMDGLPNAEETFIQARLRNSVLNLKDLGARIPVKVTEKLRPLGTFNLNGNFIGLYNDFVATGKFRTALGLVDSDLNLKVDLRNFERSTYRGSIRLEKFEVGKLVGDTALFQNVSMSGRIEGKGISLETADLILDGEVRSLGVRHYDYQNITTRGRFANKLFEGLVTVRDPNLRMVVTGSVDLRHQPELVRLHATIDTAALQPLRIVQQPLSFRTGLKINTRGLTLDELAGNAVLHDLHLAAATTRLDLDSLRIHSEKTGKVRRLSVNTSLGSLDLMGNFNFDALSSDLQNIFRELYLNARNDRAALRDYYATKQPSARDYRIDFLARFQDLNPIFSFMGLDATISRRIQMTGHFVHGLTTILHAYASVPKFTWKGRIFTENEIDFNGSKLQDTTSVLAMLLISSARQQFTDQIATKDLVLEGIWNKDHVDIGLDFDQVGYDNSFRIKSELDFLEDGTLLRLLPSRIRLLGKQWSVNPGNRITIRGPEIEFAQVELTNDGRSMLLEGNLSEKDYAAELKVSLRDLTLDLINSLIPEKLDGKLNGEVRIRNVYGNTSFQNTFNITGFTVNEFLVGDLTGTNNWDADQEAFVISFLVERMQSRAIDLTGLYVPDDPENSLRLTARFNQTQLKTFEPVVRDLFSNLGGTFSGIMDIGGTLARPVIQGDLDLNDAQLTVNYLNTAYRVNGQVGITPRSIDLRNLELRDAFLNKGSLRGSIAHNRFSDFRLNLQGDFRNFQVLNTSARQNSLFYGQAYGTGTVAFTGPPDNLVISATARTDKNTRVFIPINGTSGVERGDFIHFVSLRDTAAARAAEAEKKKEESRFSMNLNIEVTPDAYSEIIFDIKAGDIIRGYGRGNLKLDLDTRGEFNMFGLYEFERGFYNFTLGGVINKEFTINRGSKISWYGDPYGATLSINASYRQQASLAPVLAANYVNTTMPASLKRRFPIEVILNLEGPMLSPQINFDIEAKDLPENLPGDNQTGPVPVKFQFNAFKSRMDEQELKKQVFSLIVLRKFSPPEAFTTSGGIANSVSEFLSNQLSYWLSQVDQNLEVSLNLGSLDTDALNISQLRMSYSLMNGRLRITRDGTLFSSQYTQSNVAALAGDWTVDYLLTADGMFKVKMYSRSNYNMLLSSINTQTSYTTGLSLSHTQNFNRFSELLKASHRRQRRSGLGSEADE